MCYPDDQILLQELHGSAACSLPIPLIPCTRPQRKPIGLKTNGEGTAHPSPVSRVPGATLDAREPQSLCLRQLQTMRHLIT